MLVGVACLYVCSMNRNKFAQRAAHMPAIPRTTSLTRWSCWSLTRTQHTLQALFIWSLVWRLWIGSTWDRLLCWSYKEISWVQSWFGDYSDCRHARSWKAHQQDQLLAIYCPQIFKCQLVEKQISPVGHGQIISCYIYIDKLYRKTISCKISFHGWSQADRTHLEPWCMHVCGWQTLGTLEQFSQLISVGVMDFGRFFSRKTTLALSSTAISLVELPQLEWVEGSSWPEPRRGCRDVQKKTNSKTPPWKIRDSQKWKDRILSNHWFSEVNC